MTVENLEQIVSELKIHPNPETTQNAITALAEFLYIHLKHYRLCVGDEDTRSDFFVWLYPRFSRILTQFDPNKASLKTYINLIIRLTFKTFCRERCGKEARQQVYIAEEETRILSEMADQANSEEWNETVQEKKIDYRKINSKKPIESISSSPKQKEILNRQLLLLACKSGYNINDEIINKIVQKSGMSEEYLRNTLDSVRQRCMLSLDHLRIIRERRYFFYLRAQKNLMEMKKLDSNTPRFSNLEHEYQYCQKRIQDLKIQSDRIHTAPSNRFLAKVLGIARGTVDTTLAAARNHE